MLNRVPVKNTGTLNFKRMENCTKNDLTVNVRKRNIGRFKAGAELSGKVNLMGVELEHAHMGDEELFELKLENATHGFPSVTDPSELDTLNDLPVMDPRKTDLYFKIRRVVPSVVEPDLADMVNHADLELIEGSQDDEETIELKVRIGFKKILHTAG